MPPPFDPDGRLALLLKLAASLRRPDLSRRPATTMPWRRTRYRLGLMALLTRGVVANKVVEFVVAGPPI